jgi:alkylation response protein AidB-like acyl-CoA dehydrogenase
MDFDDSPEEAEFRAALRTWLDETLPRLAWPEPAELTDRVPFWRTWQQRLYEAGYAGLSWPEEYGGRGASVMEQAIFAAEMDRAGAPDRMNIIGEGFTGPTIIDHGTDEQKRRFLEPILTGEHIWCQLFSEPGAGSDLAALSAKATKVDGGFRITGQKVWTSRAHVAQYGILLARTGGGERHRGITYFLLPMDTEGVTVQPLRHMLGEPEFNEVFLEDAFVPDELVLGDVDGGWKVAMDTLGYERVTLATGRVNVQALMRDLIAMVREGTDAEGRPLGEDPVIRDKVADFYSRALMQQLTSQRVLTRMAEGSTGPESSIGKLFLSPLVEELADFALSLHALGGQLDQRGDDHDRWLRLAYQARGTSIAGGTTFIQRNIVAERVLGLPRR